MPAEACGLPVTTLVIVDGGERPDRPVVAKDVGRGDLRPDGEPGPRVRAAGSATRSASSSGAQYVVTLDADGQNDPGEIPVMLQPLVDDEADFVVASRVLGRDTTTDHFRKAGVRVFSWVMSAIGTHQADRHLQRLPGPAGQHARRRGLPPRPGAVPDGRAADHRHAAGLARHRAPHGVAAPGLGHDQEGTNWLFGFRYGRVVLGTWWKVRKESRHA